MLYLGIDQHKRQLTVNFRAEDRTVILNRQVSAQWEKVRAFLADLAERTRPEGGFLAILEACGMNPWLWVLSPSNCWSIRSWIFRTRVSLAPLSV